MLVTSLRNLQFWRRIPVLDDWKLCTPQGGGVFATCLHSMCRARAKCDGTAFQTYCERPSDLANKMRALNCGVIRNEDREAFSLLYPFFSAYRPAELMYWRSFPCKKIAIFQTRLGNWEGSIILVFWHVLGPQIGSSAYGFFRTHVLSMTDIAEACWGFRLYMALLRPG